jgi:predicted GIY-YIG superfamily endonuclease
VVVQISSPNLKQRLTDHFQGGTVSTAPRRPLRLIFCEYFFSKKDALRRELYFKTTKGKRTLRSMLRNEIFAGDTQSRLASELVKTPTLKEAECDSPNWKKARDNCRLCACA